MGQMENLSDLFKEIAQARNIDESVLINAILTGISIAAQKKTGLENLRAIFDRKSGTFSLLQTKIVKDEVADTKREISVEDAQKTAPGSRAGETVTLPYRFEDIGRLAAVIARKMMAKTISEIEADNEYAQLTQNQWRMVTATVRGKGEDEEIHCDVANVPAELPRQEQAFRESFEIGELIKVVVVAAARRGNDSVYIISRTHPLLLRFLLIMEVPEIKENIIEIKSLARDTAGRSKVAVFCANEDIDAVGACVGPAGARIQRIIKELKGENIDIIEWSENPEKFIAAALKPATVKSVKCDEATHEAIVELDKDQHSIAVGKKGLNIRLASRLTQWNIRINQTLG